MKKFTAIKESLRQRAGAKWTAVKGITRKDVLTFGKNCLPTLGLMGFYLLGTPHVTFAVSSGITPLDKPLTTIQHALTGPIPIAVVAGSVALGGMSWAMGWEQQVMMRCVKGAGGGAIAMGVGNFMSSVLDKSPTDGIIF